MSREKRQHEYMERDRECSIHEEARSHVVHVRVHGTSLDFVHAGVRK